MLSRILTQSGVSKIRVCYLVILLIYVLLWRGYKSRYLLIQRFMKNNLILDMVSIQDNPPVMQKGRIFKALSNSPLGELLRLLRAKIAQFTERKKHANADSPLTHAPRASQVLKDYPLHAQAQQKIPIVIKEQKEPIVHKVIAPKTMYFQFRERVYFDGWDLTDEFKKQFKQNKK